MRNIVVIDDSAANIKIISKLSETACPDGVIKSFSNPQPALQWLKENKPDLIITDYKMPGMTGAEFTRSIRRLPTCGEVPVIVVTAYSDRAYRIEALEAGATDFILSPLDFNEFQPRIRNLLKLSGQQRVAVERAQLLEEELQQAKHIRDQILRDSHDQLTQVIDTIPVMISALDQDGNSIFSNAYHAQLMGAAWRRPIDERDYFVLNSGEPAASIEEALTDLNGRERTFLTRKSPLKSLEGKTIAVLTTSLDISDRKRSEKELMFLAEHDHLTHLPNRYYLNNWLTREIDGANAAKRPFALYYIDLDRFKYVNDGHGHHFGDQLLQSVSKRLLHAVRNGDVVARLGGDEFAILQLGIQSFGEVMPFAERINTMLREPFHIEGREMTTSASIGVTIYPWDGNSAEELLQNADLAMYRVKARGRNGVEIFTQNVFSQAREEIRVRSQLRGALEREEFVLHYQPQIDLKTGQVVGAEALIRWSTGQPELVGPGLFMQLAEDSNIIRPIDEWVLREACRQARRWKDSLARPLRVSVNLSSQTFRWDGLSAMVLEVLNEEGVSADLLELELTEEVLLGEGRTTHKEIEKLRAAGVRLSIDDFGTGYSSFARLSSLPIDTIKVDRSFVTNLSDVNNVAIVKAVVHLGQTLGAQIVAEGVETQSQLEIVIEAGCDLVQGFFTGRPMDESHFNRFLLQRKAIGQDNNTPQPRLLG